MIKKHFKKIEKSLDNHSHIIEDQIIKTNTFADDKGSIEGEIFFIDETTLDFMEVVNTNKTEKEKYKYYYMDKEKQIIFRYDNAQHHRDLKTFPHHKHTENNVEESKEPNFDIVLNEIENKLINK
jgi:hypothetical protein